MDISDLINLFLINAEILLRITSRNQTIQTTCTLGGQEPSICKSYYSTRCATTTSVINTFFQKRAIYYDGGVGSGYSINDISLNDYIFNSANLDNLYDSTSYDDYVNNLIELYDLIYLEDVIFTFSFSAPNVRIPFDNLVGHIFNIIRKKIFEAPDPRDNIYKNFLIQSYINKYSPVCIEINDDVFLDYIRVFYAIYTHSTYDFQNVDVPQYNDNVYDNIYTMYVQDNTSKHINPWFNETFHRLFKEFYYYPYDNLGNVNLSSDPNDLRYYTVSRMSISSLFDNDVIYYNMLNYLYAYYNILSYDIYSYRKYYNNSYDQIYSTNTNYMITDYHEYIDTKSNEKNINEYYNPTLYYDNTLLTNNAHTISFWENNLYVRTSYIISDNHVNINDEFTYDLYSTLLFSTKNSILYTLNYKNIFGCTKDDLLSDIDYNFLINDCIILKYITDTKFTDLSNLLSLSNLLQYTFLPTYNLITSFDIYDYFNNKSCLVYDLFTKIVLKFQNELNTFTDPNDHPLMLLCTNFVTTIRSHSDFSLNINQKIYYLYMYVLKISDTASFDTYENIDVIDLVGDTINIRKYDERKITAFLNITIPIFGFYLMDEINKDIDNYYQNNVKDNPNVAFMTFYDFINFYYTSPYDDVNVIILEIFNYIVNMIDVEYQYLFGSNSLIDNTLKRSYYDYIKFLKNYLINSINIDENIIIDSIKNDYKDDVFLL